MKQIDLGPNNYRKQGPDGQWRLPDDPRLCRFGFFLCAVILGVIYWYRDEVTAFNLFGVTVVFAFAGGILFSQWLKDVY